MAHKPQFRSGSAAIRCPNWDELYLPLARETTRSSALLLDATINRAQASLSAQPKDGLQEDCGGLRVECEPCDMRPTVASVVVFAAYS